MLVSSVSILLIEDSPTAARLIEYWLEEGLDGQFTLRRAASLAEGLAALAQKPANLIVLDLNLPDSEGLDTFRRLHERAGGTPVVIMSSESDEEVAVEAVRLGAEDYIVKESSAQNPLTRPIRFALERVRRGEAEAALSHTTQQLRVASEVQQQLFPSQRAEIPGCDVAGRCVPAETCGGDYYDLFSIGGHRHALVIGDVSGHGIGAALTMVSTRSVLRALSQTYTNPGYLLTSANDVLLPDMDRFFVSMFVGRFDPATRRLSYASAGQPAFVLDAGGHCKADLGPLDPPLGVAADIQFQSLEYALEPGDTLVLYTDGISESRDRDGREFGVERLKQLAGECPGESAQQTLDRIFQRVSEVRGGRPQVDDETALIVRIHDS